MYAVVIISLASLLCNNITILFMHVANAFCVHSSRLQRNIDNKAHQIQLNCEKNLKSKRETVVK